MSLAHRPSRLERGDYNRNARAGLVAAYAQPSKSFNNLVLAEMLPKMLSPMLDTRINPVFANFDTSVNLRLRRQSQHSHCNQSEESCTKQQKHVRQFQVIHGVYQCDDA